MIGIDTNILFRWVFDDLDPDQTAQVQGAVAQSSGAILICVVVMVEFIWLMDRRLRLDRARQITVMRAILGNSRLVISERDAVVAALSAFEIGGAGLADHLIGALNTAAGCSTTLTFDKVAGKGPSFTILA
jgi:predicted nucleic-acid-binding protein